MNTSIYDFSVVDALGQSFAFSELKGKVILIVNVASECGFTSQYDGLEALYQRYKAKGFVVLGFPCNQFGGQEPGTESQIVEFCRKNHGVSFPLMSKVEVNGAAAAPIFQYLKSSAPGLLGSELIKWNFTKFLVGRDGRVLERYAPATAPDKIANDIEKALSVDSL